MPLKKEQHEAIQKEGANARALGRSYIDNPWLRSDQSPRVTGLTTEEWTERHDAWHLGWTVEDAIRGPRL